MKRTTLSAVLAALALAAGLTACGAEAQAIARLDLTY